MVLRHSEDYFIRTLLGKVRLNEIMVKEVIALNVNDPFSRVEEIMRERHVRHIPVVDEHYKLVGIITQRDLYRIQPPRKDEDGNWFYNKEMLDGNILKHVMTKNPFALNPDHTVADCLLIMVDRKYGCIPVVDKDRILCGIVTQIDILRIGAQIIREGRT